jgi:neurotransmitter:Na+ symporter, NSS family
MAGQETFSSRWGLILAGLGMAVGTGSMWRFPRIAAQNGGAAFLIPWLIFLFVWSIPLLIAEFAAGRGTRRGVVGAFATLSRGRYAWMGGFVAAATTMILFYYSVVTGWTIRYFLASATGQLTRVDATAFWESFIASGWQPVLFHVVAALFAAYVISRGVVQGIEKANRILVPSLFVLLVLAALRAVTLPGASRGLEFLFNPDLAALSNSRTWLEALSQSAWSTGAGWGLLLTYGSYAREREDVVLNSATMGFGVYTASLLAGIAVVPTAFAFLSPDEAMTAMRAGNEGLMFIWIPQLFAQIPMGGVFLMFFMLALMFAALSSIIAMFELATRVVMDLGLTRSRALRLVTGATIVFGLPSALSLRFFQNQDWVWGLGLMMSGLFISLAVARYGLRRFRTELVNTADNELNAGRPYEWVLRYLVPLLFAVMFGWWMYQAAAVYDPEGWWNPLHIHSVGTCIVQWGALLAVLLFLNRRLAEASTRQRKGTAV